MKPKIGKPTPGPWKMEFEVREDHSGYAPGRQVFFTGGKGDKKRHIGFTMQGRVDDEEGNANAYLVWAAPDLLTAAKLFLETHRLTCKGPDCREMCVDLFEAAVAKADGKVKP